jgi:hypothetical protein
MMTCGLPLTHNSISASHISQRKEACVARKPVNSWVLLPRLIVSSSFVNSTCDSSVLLFTSYSYKDPEEGK